MRSKITKRIFFPFMWEVPGSQLYDLNLFLVEYPNIPLTLAKTRVFLLRKNIAISRVEIHVILFGLTFKSLNVFERFSEVKKVESNSSTTTSAESTFWLGNFLVCVLLTFLWRLDPQWRVQESHDPRLHFLLMQFWAHSGFFLFPVPYVPTCFRTYTLAVHAIFTEMLWQKCFEFTVEWRKTRQGFSLKGFFVPVSQ